PLPTGPRPARWRQGSPTSPRATASRASERAGQGFARVRGRSATHRWIGAPPARLNGPPPYPPAVPPDASPADGRAPGLHGRALVAVLRVLLEFRHQARRIAPEPLLAACLVAAASFAATAPSSSRPIVRHLVAGAWLGAAWLAKGSALLSLGATLVAVVVGAG